MSSTGCIPHIVAVLVVVVVAVWSLCLSGHAGHMTRKAMGLGHVTRGSVPPQTAVQPLPGWEEINFNNIFFHSARGLYCIKSAHRLYLT